MATKIYCAAIDCEYWGDGNRCTAKEVHLSDHSIMTAWDGRQRFQKCKTWQESVESKAIREKLLPLMEKMMNEGRSDNH